MAAAAPDGIRCPISLEIMDDPVMLIASGHSYERSHILQWLKTNSTCPKSGIVLTDKTIAPNWNLRSTIEEWKSARAAELFKGDMEKVAAMGTEPMSKNCKSISGNDAKRILKLIESKDPVAVAIGCAAVDRVLMRFLCIIGDARAAPEASSSRSLSNNISPDNDMRLAAELFRILASEGGNEKKIILTRPGSVRRLKIPTEVTDHTLGALVVLLAQGTPFVREAVAQNLRILGGQGMGEKVVEAGAIGPLLDVLEHGTKRAIKHAGQAITKLAAQDDTKGWGRLAAILAPPLVRMASGDSYTEARENAVVVLSEVMSRCPSSLGVVMEEGAIPPLLNLLETGSAEEKRRSGLLLAGLAGVNATRMVEEGALGPLIRQLVEGTPQEKEKSAAALLPLAAAYANRDKIVKEGAVGPLVRLLEEGIPGARDKAAGVLGFLCVGNDLIRVSIAAAGALGPLVQHLVEGSPKGKEYAVGVLRNMALDQENRRAMVKDLNALPLIVDLLKHGLPVAQEQAAWTLFNISQDDGACFQASIIDAGSVPYLVHNAKRASRADIAAEALLLQLGFWHDGSLRA